MEVLGGNKDANHCRLLIAIWPGICTFQLSLLFLCFSWFLLWFFIGFSVVLIDFSVICSYIFLWSSIIFMCCSLLIIVFVHWFSLVFLLFFFAFFASVVGLR